MTKGYQYKGSGLDYVYLVNGYKVHETRHGKGVSITDADGLHHTIAAAIVTGSHPICGQEVRFLRSMLGISQSALACIMNVERGQVTRWEKDPHKPLPGTADVALRLFSALNLAGNATAKKLVERLKECDEGEYKKNLEAKKTSKMSFKETSSGWLREAA